MSWLALFFILELGYLPNGYQEIYLITNFVDEVEMKGEFYIDFNAEVTLFDLFFIGGGVKTYIWKYNFSYTFWPNTAGYSLIAGINLGILEIGFRHYCYHPVLPWTEYINFDLQWEGAYEEIYVRLEGSFRGK
ncbi:hypothetical protein ES705_17564 [subsurface metagenome]